MPAAEYESRLRARRASFVQADGQSARLGNVRLLIVLIAILAGWCRLWWVVALDAAMFIAVGVAIQRLNRKRDGWQRAITYYERSLARLRGDWAGRGQGGEAYLPAEHLYARDLDLFGRGSLFELLCQARTRSGTSTLASWLLNAAGTDTVRQRQQAVEELKNKLDLRESLAVIGEGILETLRATLLEDWGEAPPTPLQSTSRPVMWALTVLGAAAAIALIADILGVEVEYLKLFYIPVAVVCASVLWRSRQTIHAVLHGAEGAAHEVAILADVLERLEKESFASPLLAGLRGRLDVQGLPPSKRIRQLRVLMDLVDSRDHFLVRLLGPLVLYDLHLALALENWRKTSGGAMRTWVNAVGEIEALSSLANYAYENPTDVFPDLLEGGARFEATELRHPLMPRAIPDDVSLGDSCQVLIVSGSNMSGKSTLMRTVGVNAVLALAGGPVRAARLRLSPLAIGASISTHDSLQGNTSRFYAEILRLRDIMQKAAGATPVLFLIDEVLSGTNSHDRRIGAAAIIQGLADRHAIGIATTHDLALTQIADERARNVHFEDQLVDGAMQFDYKMRPGVVTHSNAIALMRAIGLEV